MTQDNTAEQTEATLEFFCNLFKLLEKQLVPIIDKLMPVLFQKIASQDATIK